MTGGAAGDPQATESPSFFSLDAQDGCTTSIRCQELQMAPSPLRKRVTALGRHRLCGIAIHLLLWCLSSNKTIVAEGAIQVRLYRAVLQDFVTNSGSVFFWGAGAAEPLGNR